MRLVRGIGQRIAALPPFAVLLIGWLFLILYAFPGQMTQDSFDHLREARSGIYSDSHPPAINLVFKLCDFMIAGPFGMLLIQSTAFLLGLYLILRRTFTPHRAAWFAVAVFVFPPVMTPMAVIWKDCMMAGFLVLGAAGLLSQRRGPQLWGVLAMFGATAVRYNAFAATFPLIILFFEWRPGMHWLRRYALATGVWFATTFAAFEVNAAITDHEMHYWHSSLALYDIVGTLAHVEEPLPDAELRDALAGTDLVPTLDLQAHIRAVYSPRDFFPILNDPKLTMWNVPINGYEPAPAAQRDAIAHAWWDTLTSHPGAYVKHRIAVMGEVLAISSPQANPITTRDYRFPAYVHDLGLSTGWSSLQLKLTQWMRLVWRYTPLFLPWIYLVISLLLLPLARRHRDVLAILFSGLIMESSLVPLAHSNDYRYSHWMVICTILAVIILTARRARAPKT